MDHIFSRLHELEQQMVGGEQIDNVEVKERRKKRKTFAEERKRKLAGKDVFFLLNINSITTSLREINTF